MRILIDMQACQNGSRFRGIGRYTTGIVTEMLKVAKNKHECFLLFNGAFTDNLDDLIIHFSQYVPSSHLFTWYGVMPTEGHDTNNTTRKHLSIILRDSYIQRIAPDVVFLPTFFEGYDDNSVISTQQFSPQKRYLCVSTCHDLIPLVQSEVYLDPHPVFKAYYLNMVKDYKNSDGFLSVSESSKSELVKYLNINPENIQNTSEGVEYTFKNSKPNLNKLAKLLNIPTLQNKKIILYSGASDERKNHLRLIKAYASIQPQHRKQCVLVFAGGMPGDHVEKFKQYASLNNLGSDELLFTGRISDEAMIDLYSACYLFVFPSWHEGFGLPALEAMSCGAPVIASNTTSLPEVVGHEDLLFDPYSVPSITYALEKYIKNETLRNKMANYCYQRSKEFSWKKSATTAIEFFETLYAKHLTTFITKSVTTQILENQPSTDTIIHTIKSSNLLAKLDDDDKQDLAVAIIKNSRKLRKNRRIYVDISILVRVDFLTGIQRVVHEIYQQIVKNYSDEYDIIPVTYNEDHYDFEEVTKTQYARPTSLRLSRDDFLDFRADDIFLGLDLDYRIAQMASFFERIKSKGCKIYFVVYDILPLKIGNNFFTGDSTHAQYHWLNALTQADGLISISKSVMHDLTYFLNMYDKQEKNHPIKLGWFHLGADFNIDTSKQEPSDLTVYKDVDFDKPTFIMVGSIEPRKGHLEILEAFNQLWEKGYEGNLIIIASRTWNSNLTVELIRINQFLDKKLFWFNKITDDELAFAYSNATALIAASVDEGFGLPIVEALHRNLNIICRDILVFQEVAGDNAVYFKDGNHLSQIIQAYQPNLHKIKSANLLTWEQSTKQLLDTILLDNFSIIWEKNKHLTVLPICSEKFGTRVGAYHIGSDRIRTISTEGLLLFGGFINLKKGKCEIYFKGKSFKSQNIVFQVVAIINNQTKILYDTMVSFSLSNTMYDIPEEIGVVKFSLNDSYENVEFYINVKKENDFYISSFDIYQ